MKKIPTKNYLIIGCYYLGASQGVLKLLSRVAEDMDATTIHLGGVLSPQDVRKYQKLQEQADRISNEEKLAQVAASMYVLEKKENKAFDALKNIFTTITFVANEDQCIGSNRKLSWGMSLSRKLLVVSAHPSGPRTSSNPLATVAVKTLWDISQKNNEASIIVPHPIQRLISQPTPGVNTALTYATTGCLYTPGRINTPYQRCFSQAQPGGIFVSIDKEKGQYHVSRVVIVKKGSSYTCAIDDMVWSNTEEIEEVQDVITLSCDVHTPYEDIGSKYAVVGAQSILPVSEHIILGDGGDLRPLCPHIETKLRKRENLRLKPALDAIKNYVLFVGAKVPVKYLLGNHEMWLDKFIDRNPQLEGMLDWEHFAEANKITVIRDTGATPVLKIGDLTARHGHQESLAAALKMFAAYVCGHWHRREEQGRHYMLPSSVNELELDYGDGAIGCSVNGFTILAVDGRGQAHVTPHVVLSSKDGRSARFCLRGQIYMIELPE